MATKFDPARITRMFSDSKMLELNDFVEKLPTRSNKNMLIAAGVAWMFIGVCVVYINFISAEVATLRADLIKADAVKPVVPILNEINVSKDELDSKMVTIKKVFPDVNITTGEGNIAVAANEARFYGPYLQTSYAIMSLGNGYKVTLKELCEGSGCK